MNFPKLRLRRLRENPKLRRLTAESSLLVKDLVQPLFVKEGLRLPAPIASMPGQFQHSEESLVRESERLARLGVSSVILFGIPARKDIHGRRAFAKKGIVQRAIARIRKKAPSLLVIADVCLCEYLKHGHCGLIKNGKVDNDSTLKALARVAVSCAGAGADVIAPSDMMDGRVAAIRAALDRGGFKDLPILSYAVKYASSLYSPFRDAAENAPAFGDRGGYQMNAANAEEAIREARTDLEEGADMLLVKPALAYGDIVRRLRERFSCPVGAFVVSGEYAMIKAAADRGWLDERKAVIETHLGMKRAGASFLITYWAAQLARWSGKKDVLR